MTEVTENTGTAPKGFPFTKGGLFITVVMVLVVAGVVVWLTGGLKGIIPGTNTSSSYLSEGLVAQNSGDYSTATSDYLKAITAASADPHLVTIAYFDLGVVAQHLGHEPQALGYYAQALTITPKYVPALYNSGVALTPTNQTAALADYEKALAVSPNDADTLFNAGLIEYKLGRLTLARTMIKHAISVNPQLATRVPTSVSLTANVAGN